jgi:class 3 adenylate cyclase/predicted ATPase
MQREANRGAVMNVGGWLRGLGLEQYEAAFRENAISEKVLPNLTAEDLKDLGVGMVGHRRLLLDAIAALRAEASAPTPLSEPPLATDKAAKDTAERRQVTVMFSDLVGSTALSARMDPEDLREVISAYQRCVADTVGRFGGFVAKFMGDGVLIYFGYPKAHEDDAERSVRAGLELVAAVGALKTHAPLQTRIGIATGLVVVGDLIGSGASQEQAIVGETPNLAARLQSIAEPDKVVIADATRKLLGNLFELQDLGARELKGIAGPVRAWAPLRPSSAEGRFEALHASGLTALVGREEEFELLLGRWSRAKSAEGQVVLLSGEAGIGKSRLTAALLDRVVGEPHTRLRYFCSPQHTDSALYPVIGQMERAAGLGRDDLPVAKLEKLDAVLARTSTSIEDAALFAEMLSLPNDDRHPVLELPPQHRRERTFAALTGQVEALARQNPVLMIFEDAHWADPTSLELLGRVVQLIASSRALLIVTFRPEFEAPWIGHPSVTPLTINRLTQSEIGAMIDRVAGDNLLPAKLRQDIVERSDGIPLFVEEMTKAVLEAEGEGAGERVIAVVPSPLLSVPPSLHASLMARLDRLGSAKEAAQIGAAIGREFSHALLAAVARQAEAQLGSALNRLIQAGLLSRQGAAPNASYLFKHALVQDAAYGTLLRDQRRRLHTRIFEALESQFADIAENQPELLAHHSTEAGLIERAAVLWSRAGERSLARSALAEGVVQLTRAIDQIASLPATPALRAEQIRLQVALITPFFHLKGYIAPETKAAAERAHLLIEKAEVLGEPPDDPLLLFSVLYSFWNANVLAFNGDAVRELGAQFLTLAERRATPAPRMIGHRLLGSALVFTGDIAEGRVHLDRGMALYDPAAHRSLATRFGQDMGVTILSWRHQGLWVLGYPEAALADVEKVFELAREIGQIGTLIYARIWAPITLMHCGNYVAANAQLEELLVLVEEKGALFWKGPVMLYVACSLVLLGNFAEAVQMFDSCIHAYRSTGATLSIPYLLSFLARAFAGLGQFDKAWGCIDEAISLIETTKETWCEAEINRVAGEIALRSSVPEAVKAEAYFERALAVAQSQQAKSWELRAAMSMARLWRDHGKRNEARELLAPVYGWFTEGFDTLDLKQAKVLLDELAQ